MTLHSRPELPGVGRLSAELWDIQLGLTTAMTVPPGLWNITIGSASDRPFASGEEWTADVTWAIGAPFLIGFINWQNNRDWLNGLPIPGAALRAKQGNWFTAVAGFPYSAIGWRPVKQWELAASYEFPRTIYTQIRYRPTDSLKLFAGFEWDNQRYFRHDREDRNDRLWYVEKRLVGGVRWDLSEHGFLEAFAGYAFDRFWFEGHTYEDRHDCRIDIGDGPFAGVQFGLRF